MDVYLDAVFHPRCISDPKVFEQEGRRCELHKAFVDKEVLLSVFKWSVKLLSVL